MCDITGVAVVYGSGGGGGGTLRLGMGTDKLSHCDGGEGGLNAGRGGKVTWTVVEDDGAVVTNVYLAAATMPAANTGSGGAGGTYEQAVEQMKNYNVLVEKMRDFILSRTKIDQKLFKKNKAKDWYIYTDEMLEYGIVDEIVKDLDILF